PRAVADDAHRLALLREVAHEADRVLVQAQLIGVPDAAGYEQRVVIRGLDLLDGLVDREAVRRVEVVEPTDLAVVDRDQLGLRSGRLERLARLRQLDLLEHVGREDRDPLAVQLAHVAPFVAFPCAYRGAAEGKRLAW